MLYSCSCSKFWASRSRQCWRLHASADDLDDGDHNDQYEDDSDGVPDKHDQYDRDEHGKKLTSQIFMMPSHIGVMGIPLPDDDDEFYCDHDDGYCWDGDVNGDDDVYGDDDNSNGDDDDSCWHLAGDYINYGMRHVRFSQKRETGSAWLQVTCLPLELHHHHHHLHRQHLQHPH